MDILMKKLIKVGGQFSGVGAFDQALKRLNIQYENIYQAEWDKYARQTYLHNYEEPIYYTKDVHDTPTEEITEKYGSLDIAMFSPPCQAFSLAGKRLGKEDKRGILFFNSHEFIQKNKPRYFIFENVKGLLSSKNGLQYENILYLCLYNFQKIEQWQNLNTQKNNLNLLSQTLAPYLYMNWSKKLGLRRTKCGTSFISNSELNYEKLGKIAGSGLKRRLKFLETRICQITKKPNYCHVEQIVQFGCKEEDLVLNQEKFYLIENLFPKAISILEKTVDINVNTSLFANPLLEENSKKGKLYTMLMELNSTTDPRIFMYVIEMNIIRLIILALDLSSSLWERIWHILIGKQAFIGLKTFDEWLFMLDHLNYHLYWKVLNAKDYGVPQNRERVFLIGIRDDEDNNFRFPLEETLTKRLKDVLEADVDEKYFLSEAAINKCLKSQANENMLNEDVPEKSRCIVAGYYKQPFDGQYLKIKSATSKGHEEATEGDSVNLSAPNSKTRRGRVGKGVAQTLDTGCQQAVILGYTRDSKGKVVSRNIWEQAGTIHTSSGSGGNTDQFVMTINEEQSQETEDNVSIGALRGRVEKNEEEQSGNYNQKLEINNQGTSNTITSVQKDNLVVYNQEVIQLNPSKESGGQQPYQHNRVYADYGLMTTLDTDSKRKSVLTNCEIRRLTPRECFRLMDFPDTFTWPVSDSQAYKQAGNSIVVNVLYKILKSLNL